MCVKQTNKQTLKLQTLSFQHTDVTESPSTDRSHNLVTCAEMHENQHMKKMQTWHKHNDRHFTVVHHSRHISAKTESTITIIKHITATACYC